MSTTAPLETRVGAGGSGRRLLEGQRPIAGLTIPHRSWTSRSTKRLFDVTLAAALVLVLTPVILVIAVVVSLTSRGGPLFVQDRVGQAGWTFRMYKFRTMEIGTYQRVLNTPALRAEYEANGYKLPDGAAQITRFGRLLRKTSLDELPQLWNVVKGDMSLVGIRPLVADELRKRGVVDQAAYVEARPGLTGLWQVEGRSALGVEDRVGLDRQYVESWTLWADIKILMRTPRALLRFGNSK